MAKTENVFQQWVDRYHPDPVLFVREVLGVDPDPWQVKFKRILGLPHTVQVSAVLVDVFTHQFSSRIF